MFRKIFVQKVPTTYPGFFVEAQLELVDKPVKIRIEIVDLKTGRILHARPEKLVQVSQIGSTVDIDDQVSLLPLESFGLHEVRFYVDGQLLDSIQFKVDRIPALVIQGNQ